MYKSLIIQKRAEKVFEYYKRNIDKYGSIKRARYGTRLKFKISDSTLSHYLAFANKHFVF